MTNEPGTNSIEERILWIIQATEEDVAAWIDRILRADLAAYPAALSNLLPLDVLLAFYRYSERTDIKGRLWAGVNRLVRHASWLMGNPEYLAVLLGVVGYLKVEPARDLVIQRALEGSLKRRWLKDGVSLHRYLLAALTSLSYDSSTAYILSRDLREPEFAALCFRAIWKHEPRAGVEKAYAVVKIGAQDRLFPTEQLLQELLDSVGLDTAWDLILGLVLSIHLDDGEKQWLIGIVLEDSLGISLTQKENYIKVHRYRHDRYEEHLIPMNTVDYAFWSAYYGYKDQKAKAEGTPERLSSLAGLLFGDDKDVLVGS